MRSDKPDAASASSRPGDANAERAIDVFAVDDPFTAFFSLVAVILALVQAASARACTC
jgi:hypothetical protein